MLTVCYMTNRRNCQFEWFRDSLARECNNDFKEIKLVVVDFHADAPGRLAEIRPPSGLTNFVHTAPKPTVWQGRHRLTKVDYFAASNARNTAICYAEDGWIAFVDDLSVLLPGWLDRIREAMAGWYIVLGAYAKVKNLVVRNGVVESYDEHSGGRDSRWGRGSDSGPVEIDGGAMFGCSLAAPVSAFLDTNGFDEDCDSLGSEDYICGIALEQNGYKLRYDRRMMTFESEEHHHIDPSFKRVDMGVSPDDKSHAILHLAKSGQRKKFPNYFGPGGLPELRQHILRGGSFPVNLNPRHCWFSGKPVEEFD